MQPFESHRPATLDEVLAVLGRSSPSKVLAGARDLFPELPIESFRGCVRVASAAAPRRLETPRRTKTEPRSIEAARQRRSK